MQKWSVDIFENTLYTVDVKAETEQEARALALRMPTGPILGLTREVQRCELHGGRGSHVADGRTNGAANAASSNGRKARAKRGSVTNQQLILDALAAHGGPMTNDEISESIEINRTSLYSTLTVMIKNGLVTRVAPSTVAIVNGAKNGAPKVSGGRQVITDVDKLGPNQQKVVTLAAKQAITVGDAVDKIGMTRGTATSTIYRLVRNGVLVKHARGQFVAAKGVKVSTKKTSKTSTNGKRAHGRKPKARGELHSESSIKIVAAAGKREMTNDDVAKLFDWTAKEARDKVSSLVHSGHLKRTQRGHFVAT